MRSTVPRAFLLLFVLWTWLIYQPHSPLSLLQATLPPALCKLCSTSPPGQVMKRKLCCRAGATTQPPKPNSTRCLTCVFTQTKDHLRRRACQAGRVSGCPQAQAQLAPSSLCCYLLTVNAHIHALLVQGKGCVCAFTGAGQRRDPRSLRSPEGNERNTRERGRVEIAKWLRSVMACRNARVSCTPPVLPPDKLGWNVHSRLQALLDRWT